MGLFGFGKKKEKKGRSNVLSEASCCSNGECTSKDIVGSSRDQEADRAVKVLGSGCAKCNELEANVKAALVQLGMDSSIEHVTDFAVIAAYGVMSTPALVVDDKVVSYGKVLKVDEAVKLLQKVRA